MNLLFYWFVWFFFFSINKIANVYVVYNCRALWALCKKQNRTQIKKSLITDVCMLWCVYHVPCMCMYEWRRQYKICGNIWINLKMEKCLKKKLKLLIMYLVRLTNDLCWNDAECYYGKDIHTIGKHVRPLIVLLVLKM